MLMGVLSLLFIMKYNYPTIVFALIVIFTFSISCGSPGNGKKEVSLSFSGAFALYPLAQVWADEYNKTHPEIRFEIQAGGAGKGLTDCLAGAVDVGMFSRELKPEELAKGVWWISLCKDAVIPTINAANPLLQSIKAKGVKKEEFNAIFTDHSIATWNDLVNEGGGTAQKINVYTRADAAGAADSWASFFGKKQDDLKGIGVNGDPGVADAVRKDRNGIGFNNTMFVFDQQTGKRLNGIEIVPIDVDGNGRLDAGENFYNDLPTFLKAINENKFPSPPARDLYFLTKGKTQKKELIEFFKWVLTDGQKMVHQAGYVQLPPAVIADQLAKLQ